MPNLEKDILSAVRETIGQADDLVLLHRPFIPPAAWTYTKECLDTGWVSSAGSFVTRFEKELAEFVGCRRAVATVNGTAALEVCFHLSGVQPGSEVICPSLTFVATPNAIVRSGAVPHFVDVSVDRLSLCPEALRERLRAVAIASPEGTRNRETGRLISAACVMHCFGHPGEIDGLLQVCGEFEIPLVEDAAESLGSYYKEKHTGRFSQLSAVSFNGNKILTTGGGGAILTDDEELADKAKHLTTTAKLPHRWEFEHDEVGWNFRMPNLNAALGASQLEVLPELLAAKRALAIRYAGCFESVRGASFLAEPSDSRSNYWLNCILLDEPNLALRDDVLQHLNDSGYQCRPIWKPMHQLPMYKNVPSGPLKNTETLHNRAINIPSSADLALDWKIS